MKRHWITIAMVMAIAISTFAGCGRPDPADTMKRFYMAVQDRRYEEALKCTPKSFRDALETVDPTTGMLRRTALFNRWDEQFAAIARAGDRIKKFVVLDEQINGNRATVKLEAHHENGKVGKLENNLVWEDGAWRILMM